MSMLISMIIWCVAGYKIASKMKESEGLDIKPINYALLSVAFSFLFSMGVLLYKISKVKENKNMKIASYVMCGVSIVINIMMLL